MNHRKVEDGAAAIIDWEHARAVCYQHACGILLVLANGTSKGRPVLRTFGVAVGAMFQQHFDNLPRAPAGCHVEWCVPWPKLSVSTTRCRRAICRVAFLSE